MGLFQKPRFFKFSWGREDREKVEPPTEQKAPNDFQEVLEVIDEVVMPIQGDRVSYPDHVSLVDFLNNFIITQPHIAKEFYDALEFLVKHNPDVSNAVENISLANTEIVTEFDETVSDALQKEMQESLTMAHRKWYKYSDSIEGLVSALLVQAATYGAVSTEGLPTMDLSGIKRIILVNPKNIFFQYDENDQEYHPLQRVPNSAGISSLLRSRDREKLMGGEYIKLNETTYKYFPLRVVGETPYGIPPFLAAVDNLVIQKDMVGNLKTVIQKIGLLGFLSVLMNRPPKKPTETDKTYQARLKTELQDNITEIKKGLSKGFLGGYQDVHEIKMNPVGQGNARGASDLIEVNDTLVMAGLKQDPAMMGRSSTTTETFGRVVLAKMAKQLENYQRIVVSTLNYYDLLHLQLQGYPVKAVFNSFERVMLGDEQRRHESQKVKQDNTFQLRDQGIIDQQQAANILGYDKPAADGPINNPANDGGGNPDDDPDNPNDDPIDPKTTDANRAMLKLAGPAPPFEYHTHHPGCDCEQMDLSGLGDDEREFWEGYLKSIQDQYAKSSKVIANKVAQALRELQEGVDIEQVITRINYTIFVNWDEDFANKIKPIVKRFVRNTYKFYRRNTAPFGKKAGIPDPTFDLLDFRAIEFYTRSDDLYLGRFITDPDTRKRVNQWIRDEHLNKGLPIGRNSKGIRLFQEKFGNQLQLEDWKVRRIIDTTLNRVRSTGAIQYMKQAQVKEFIIQGISDALQCPYCRSLQGKTFSVEKEVTKVESLVSMSPDSVGVISPFVTNTGLTPDDFKGMDGKEIQLLGIGAPPFHNHCRDTVVAKF